MKKAPRVGCFFFEIPGFYQRLVDITNLATGGNLQAALRRVQPLSKGALGKGTT
jgi:hypothetical protein